MTFFEPIGTLAATIAVLGYINDRFIEMPHASPRVDVDLRAALNQEVNDPKRLCWGDRDPLLYMRTRPPGMSDALVRLALLRHDRAAQRRR